MRDKMDLNQGPDELEEKAFLEGLNQGTTNAKPQTIIIKYNGEDKEISLGEAVVLAQKGLNYDRVLAQRDAAVEKMKLAEEQGGIFSKPNVTQEELMEAAWIEFFKRYPEVSNPIDQLPAEVWYKMDDGEMPVVAYGDYLNKKLSAETEELKLALKALESQKEVNGKTPGRMNFSMSSQVENDPFLQGLLEGIK